MPDASAEATVSCPLCQEEFTFSEILDKMPPALVVVTDPNPPIATTATKDKESSSGGGFDFAGGGDEEGFKLAPEEPSGTGFAFDEADAPQKSSASASRPRPKKKAKNPMVEIVKVVLGGVIAIPLAQLILWWAVPGGRDPVGLGAPISKFAPFLVPDQFRDPSVKEGANPGDQANNDPSDENNDPSRGTGGGNFAVDNGGGGAFAPGGQLNNANGDPVNTDPVNTDPGNADPVDPVDLTNGIGLDNPLGVGDDPDPFDPLTELPDDDNDVDPFDVDDPTGLPVPAPSGPISGIKNGPEYTTQHLQDAVGSMMQKHQTFADAAPPTADMKKEFYISVAELSDVVSILNMEDGANSASAKSLRTVAANFFNAQTLPVLRGGGKGWLNLEARPTDGVALCGKVKTFSQSGKLYETVIELPSAVEVKVVSSVHPQDFVEPGKEAIVLARIVKNPAENIINYKGDEAQAIWAGMFIAGSE
jgi:hypothetical protein